jgi:hypothetical protein
MAESPNSSIEIEIKMNPLTGSRPASPGFARLPLADSLVDPLRS